MWNLWMVLTASILCSAWTIVSEFNCREEVLFDKQTNDSNEKLLQIFPCLTDIIKSIVFYLFIYLNNSQLSLIQVTLKKR